MQYPVYIDAIRGAGEYNHVPIGGNVLYMDGHVQFIPYEQFGQFPINASLASAIFWTAGT